MDHNREPIKHTCPDIDKLIKSLNNIQDIMPRYINKVEDIDELRDILSDINYEINGWDDILEKLRRSNDELRAWGISEAEDNDTKDVYINKLELKLNIKINT